MTLMRPSKNGSAAMYVIDDNEVDIIREALHCRVQALHEAVTHVRKVSSAADVTGLLIEAQRVGEVIEGLGAIQ